MWLIPATRDASHSLPTELRVNLFAVYGSSINRVSGDGQSLISYRLRTVRVGVQATFLVLVCLAIFALIPSSTVDVDTVPYFIFLALAAVGGLVVHWLPWRELFKDHRGMWTMYAWSVLDILLITGLMTQAGGDGSPLFLLYGLTTVFFSASYPPRAQLTLLAFTFVCYFAAVSLIEDHVALSSLFIRFSILASLTHITSFLSRELIDHNARLEAEVAEHRITEKSLRKSEGELEEAQELAHLGSWSWDIKADRLSWSAELFRIYGLNPSLFGADYQTFLASVHEEDRDRVNAIVQGALDDHAPFDFEHRLGLPDGTVRVLQAQGRVEVVDGEAVRMVGTGLDVTERKKAENNERQILDMRSRQRQAVEINDTVVQGLAVAGYALDAGDPDHAKAAITKTLAAARLIVNQLLDVEKLEPGDLVRSESANVVAEASDKDRPV